ELAGEGVELVDLLVRASVVNSKRESRQLLESGAISVNGQRVGLDRRLVDSDLLHGKVALVRRGRKNWHVLRFA
ncbi:MAG TPA: S4 domain-containing protein, partial [Polyangiaceae bacterium]|nr:S4 domain-containing protein [Polyangiaceae bacterium]